MRPRFVVGTINSASGEEIAVRVQGKKVRFVKLRAATRFRTVDRALRVAEALTRRHRYTPDLDFGFGVYQRAGSQ